MVNLQVRLSLGNANVPESVILDALAQLLQMVFAKAASGIQRRVGEAAAEAIRMAPEYTSLLRGQLRGELGVIDAEPVLQAIVRNVARGVVVTNLGARRVGSGLDGGLRIEILKGDYSEVLNVRGASFQSENGYDIDWLRWLTLEGDRLLVTDHRYFAGFREWSRTGEGIMIKSRSRGWRVPPEFAGTADDNWLTRALDKLVPVVEKILQEEFQRHV